MKKWLTIIFLLMGGVIVMASLYGCKPQTSGPASRTPEQAKLEQEFEPLFDFLAQEEKDFSEVKVYKSTTFLTDKKSGDKKQYRTAFEELPSNLSGTYTISENDKETVVSISIDEKGSLTYQSPVTVEYNNAVFNLTLKKDFFENLTISDYLAEHPETYMKDISYDMGEGAGYFTDIKKQYQLSEKSDIHFSLTKRNDKKYKLVMILQDENFKVQIVNSITFA